MGILSWLFGKKETAKLDEATLVEAGVCPNCWGRMEYDNKFIDYKNDQTKSNINHDKSNQKAFVEQFVETHVTGIKLKNEGGKIHCPKCNAQFKK